MVWQSSDEPEPRILAGLHRIEWAVALTVGSISLFTLGLWFLPIVAFVVPPIWHRMVANTAVGLLLAAVSLVLSAERRSPQQLRWSRAAAVAVILLGVATLLEYLSGISFGIDTWLPNGYAAHLSGRPSPQAAFGFTLLGVSLLLVRAYKSAWSLSADLSALALVGFCLVLIGCDLFGATHLVDAGPVSIAPQTIFCFACFSFVVVARRAKQGHLFGVLVNVGIGSQMVRAMLPVALVQPFIVLLTAGRLIDAHILPAAYTRAVAAAAESLVVLCLVVWMGRRINLLERQLRGLSLTDELTKIFNRRGFYFLAQQAMRTALRAKSGMTVLFFDVDGLKRANDMVGHDAGSKLIQAMASLLVESFRESDIVGRVGGDEFAVVTVCDGGKARLALTRLENSVANFNRNNPGPVPLSFSFGLAELIQGASETLDILVSRADAQMYKNKTEKLGHRGGRQAAIT